MTQRRNGKSSNDVAVPAWSASNERSATSKIRGSYGAEVAYEVEMRGTKQWDRCIKRVKALLEIYPAATLEQLQRHLDFDELLVKRVYANLV